MAKKKEKAPEVSSDKAAPEVVEVKKEPVYGKGIGKDLLGLDLGLPSLSSDMDEEQRRDTVRGIMRQTVNMEENLRILQGEMLYEVSGNEYWKEWEFKDSEGKIRQFASFVEYGQEELGLKERSCKYLVDIYKKFVLELELPVEELKEVKWSTALETLSVINKENYRELLDKCTSGSVRHIREVVAVMRGKSKGDSDGESSDKNRRIFTLSETQNEFVTEALAIAATMTKDESESSNLAMICADFVAGAAGKGVEGMARKLEFAIDALQSAFGVVIEVKEIDSKRYAELDEESSEKEEAEVVA